MFVTQSHSLHGNPQRQALTGPVSEIWPCGWAQASRSHPYVYDIAVSVHDWAKSLTQPPSNALGLWARVREIKFSSWVAVKLLSVC
jgi:hypothetical protein